MTAGRQLAAPIFTVLVLATILRTIAFFTLGPFTAYWFDATVSTSSPGAVQLFYLTSDAVGWNEPDSIAQSVSRPNRPTRVHLQIPAGTYDRLRFDPIDRPATVVLSDMRITRTRLWGLTTTTLETIAPSQVEPVQQVQSLAPTARQITLVTSQRDPILYIHPGQALALGTHRRVETVGMLLGALGLAFLIMWAAAGLWTRPDAGIRRAWTSTVQWAVVHQTTAVAAVGLAAAIASCYPVVFFGRSFVSPDNGAPLLYDRTPFVPGYVSEGIEDAAGSDVGAMMWQDLAYTAVAGRALFHDHELPLWNRYNASGATLMGQGDSMVGDVLNLAVASTGGASWAWDARFVISRALFAIGIGLSVLACTGSLPVALALAVSSAFIGFFNYRLNHPAIFGLCYSPWILYCWIRVAQCDADDAVGQVGWLTGLLAADWMVLNSGTAKEASMLLLFLSIGGGLVFLFQKEPWREKWRKSTHVVLAHVALALLMAPLIVPFIDALHKSFTFYEHPSANQIQPALFIGLFDDVFYRAQMPAEAKVLPSTNFLVLFGCLWAVARFRTLTRDRTFVALALTAAIPLCFAFGVVPPAAIVATPFLANIIHIGNTFSVVAIPPVLLVAGYGLAALVTRWKGRLWKADVVFTLIVLGLLLALYVNATRGIAKSDFVIGYSALLLVSIVVAPLLLRMSRHPAWRPAAVLLLACAFVLVHWRNGTYLQTPFDRWVLNPQVRAPFNGRSDAVEYLKSKSAQPYRVAGFENNLFPGYGGVVGLEGFNGPDALVNRYYREVVAPVVTDGWRAFVGPDQFDRWKGLYDFLNVGRYVAFAGEEGDVSGLQLEATFDLDVYRRAAAWPRAYFANRVITYTAVPELRDRILGADRPFAAVEASAAARDPFLESLASATEPPAIVAADRYRLTSNTTTFSVIAPSRGVIVLSEVYSDGDFRATVNGRPTPILRVNHAFKGIPVDAAGVYTVKVVYWPQYLTICLVAWAAGVLLLAAMWVTARRGASASIAVAASPAHVPAT